MLLNVTTLRFRVTAGGSGLPSSKHTAAAAAAAAAAAENASYTKAEHFVPKGVDSVRKHSKPRTDQLHHDVRPIDQIDHDLDHLYIS